MQIVHLTTWDVNLIKKMYTEACRSLEIQAEMSGDFHLFVNGDYDFQEGNISVTFYDPSSNDNIYCSGAMACWGGTLFSLLDACRAPLSLCCLCTSECKLPMHLVEKKPRRFPNPK